MSKLSKSDFFRQSGGPVPYFVEVKDDVSEIDALMSSSTTGCCEDATEHETVHSLLT